MKQLVFISCFIFSAFVLVAQECTNCKKAPQVITYELDIQVPKLSDTGQSMFQWRQLYSLSGFTNSKLFELNKNCVRFLQPLVTGIGDITTPRLPEKSESSNYGDYLVTGWVRQAGEECILHLELQTTCGLHRVTSAEVPFHLSGDSAYIKGIAHQAASQLSPLADKIKAFEKKERESNKTVAFSGWGTESITIKPKKHRLAAGEETEVEISMKDCDGYPLANRQIDFTKSGPGEPAILGTTGGTVIPSSLTTDANGKAKVKFKMGSGKTALIAAHYLFNKPSGCPGAMIGSFPINTVPVKVVVEYSIDGNILIDPKVDLGGAKTEGGEEHSYYTRIYRSSFYHYPSNTPENMLLAVIPEEKLGMNNIYESEDGFFFYMKDKRETRVKMFLVNQLIHEETMYKPESETNYGRVKPQHTTTFTFYKKAGSEPMSFGINFNFQNEGEENAIGGGSLPNGVFATENDDGVKITTKRITDPNSPYKTEYLVEMDRKVGDSDTADQYMGSGLKAIADVMKGISNYKEEGSEHLRIRMLAP